MASGSWRSIAVAVFGLFLLPSAARTDGATGLAVFLLAFAGHLLHMMLGRFEGNFPGAVRLTYMAAFPILMTLPQRFPAPVTGPTTIKQHAPVDERRRYSTDPKTFHALLALAGESSADKLSQAITRAIAQTMLADLCFLIYLTDNKNQMQIASGYDLIREENARRREPEQEHDPHAHQRPATRTPVAPAFEQYLGRYQGVERPARACQPGSHL